MSHALDLFLEDQTYIALQMSCYTSPIRDLSPSFSVNAGGTPLSMGSPWTECKASPVDLYIFDERQKIVVTKAVQDEVVQSSFATVIALHRICLQSVPVVN